MRPIFSRCLVAAAFLALVLYAAPPRAGAVGTAFLTGVVTYDGAPVVGTLVTAAGNNALFTARTDTRGRFSFPALGVGTYVVTSSGKGASASLTIDLTSAGSAVALELHLKVVGAVTTTGGSTARGAGTDLTLNQLQLTRSPASVSFPSLLLQLPGAARGANGVVHINGDHGDINYVIDGVPIPQELNRDIGTEFDLNDVSFIDVLQGAYPAQYGDRFASVINVSTRVGAGTPGVSGAFSGGSYAHYDSRLSYHAPIGAGSLVVAVRGERSDRTLDPPDFDSPHDAGSNVNQFVRLTFPHGGDYTNFTLSHSYQTYQIPNYLSQGEPATTDDGETQDDVFASLQFHHAIGDRGQLTFGPSFKRSRIRDFADPQNDFTFGETMNVNNGGSSTDCAQAVNTGNFSPSTCGYALTGDRTAIDTRLNADYVLRSTAHEVRAGASYDATDVAKQFAVTLQPNNFLAPTFTPATPTSPFTVNDDAPNVGHTEEAYLQDSWRLGTDYVLDYGVRLDAFQLASTEFRDGASQVSPRVKLTRLYGPRSSVYVYYGRFFTPFSFENVSPSAAQILNLPLQRQVAAFDLRPQRDSVYEIGGHVPLGSGDLGLRVMQKDATDLIDDTEVGVTNLHQDINFNLGRIATQSAYYQVPLARQGRFYVSANHTYSVNKGCETQLLAPCFGVPDEFSPADHEQRWGMTSGTVMNDTHDGWFSFDGEYGSGLSSVACPPTTPGFCKETPHTVFDVEKAFGIRHGVALTVRIGDLLNDRYHITFLNAQGDHYSSGRTIDIGLRFGGE